MTTAYFVVKEELPFSKFNPLISVIEKLTKEDLATEINSKHFISVMADGATNAGGTDNETVVCRFVHDGRPFNRLIQYCAKVMQTIIDEYREYRRYLTRFYLIRYIERYIVRAIVLFLGEISCRFERYRFLPAIYRFRFAIYHSSFAIYRFRFAIYRFSFAMYRFCSKRYRSSLSSWHCEIHVQFPKDNLR